MLEVLKNLVTEIKKLLQNQSFKELDELEDSTILVCRKFVELSELLKNEVLDETDYLNYNEFATECIKFLKVCCSKGNNYQNLMANTIDFLDLCLRPMLNGKYPDMELKCLQLVANICVQNRKTQEKIYGLFQEEILQTLECNDYKLVNVASMIVFNMLLNGTEVNETKIFEIVFGHIKVHLNGTEIALPEFLSFLLDHIICDHPRIVELYESSSQDQQLLVLYYILDHIKDKDNQMIHLSLLQHLIKEFKNKSDCVLKTVSSYVNSIRPEMVVQLLDIISHATTQEKYLEILKTDGSLFLNIGCLLQNLQKVGKSQENVFTPIQKLDALAPSSRETAEYEKDFSYTFKTMLMKAIANLAHKNKKNQELARELEIMMAIFDNTNADARNPLIKEWSILAIRNLCEDNPENQEIVRSLNKVGNADTPLIKEFGLDNENGHLRIGKK